MWHRKRRWLVLAVGSLLGLCCAYAVLAAWDRFIGNGPVLFYGKVVDGNGGPLPGVRVTIEIRSVSRTSSPFWPDFTRKAETEVTDGGGRFSIRASRAKIISIASFEKPGWEPKDGLVGIPTSFEYPLRGYEYPPGARKRPDNPDDPIIYPMVPVKVATTNNSLN
jgi:hypothetical protein